MPVTTSWKVFNQRLIDNGSLKKTIQKRTHDKIINYDPNTNKLSYQMILCLGLLPDELVEDKLIEPIYKYNHMKVMKNDILDIPNDYWGVSHYTEDGTTKLKVPVRVLINPQIERFKDEMFEKCSYKYLTNVSHKQKCSIEKRLSQHYDPIRQDCHCNHKNGNQCLRHFNEWGTDVIQRMNTLYNTSYKHFPGVHLGMCNKHRKEWNESTHSHKKQMIQNQLDNLGFHVNKYGYLLRGNPNWK
jgi:hypothetical protein